MNAKSWKRAPAAHRNEEDGDFGVIDAIARIKAGVLDPAQIPAGSRRECVAYLAGEGVTTPEIARLLRVSDRTVRRDRAAIREACALEHDPSLPAKMAGWLYADAENCIDRIRRAMRDPATPAAVKIEGERACYQILSDLVQRFQSMGYLPMASRHVHANVTVSEALSLAELASAFGQVAAVAEGEGDAERAEQLRVLAARVDRAGKEGSSDDDADG